MAGVWHALRTLRGAGGASLTAVTQPPPPPGWYPDPAGSAGTRWWDGQGWTDHVQQAAPRRRRPRRRPPSAAAAAVPRRSGRAGASLYEQPVLVVTQKTKLIELTNEYAVYDGTASRSAPSSRWGRAR